METFPFRSEKSTILTLYGGYGSNEMSTRFSFDYFEISHQLQAYEVVITDVMFLSAVNR